jgi:dUTP pyrophosphatase
MIVKFIKLKPSAIVPEQMSSHASGYDLFACLDEDLSIGLGERLAIPTGIALEIPIGYEAQIRPRSGLALKLGLGILNSPGTIDADYRGEIKIILVNIGQEPVLITPSMRIAQIVFTKVETVEFVAVDKLSQTLRESGGFGHTGQ